MKTNIPSFSIVGAPRSGTTSLFACLDSHPGVFMCRPKEPHYFSSDLPCRFWNPYADRQRYLELFDRAGDRLAGEASTHYLYSKAAPGGILAMSPAAKIIIMLRDPVAMVRSVHRHGLYYGYEDLTSLEEALAAEEDRRHGRRIPRLCHYPLALQYTHTARYAQHVRRYLEAFGRDRVKCILFDDLKADPERTYHEALAFLGLEPAGSPDLRAHNKASGWRSPRIARMAWAVVYPVARWRLRNPDRTSRKVMLALAGLAFQLQAAFNHTEASSAMSPELGARLRELFQDDVRELELLIERDLSPWLPSASS